jgi:rRNA-processing protein FCF1
VRFPLEAEIRRHTEESEVRVPGSVIAELDRLVSRGVPEAATARSLADRYPVARSPGRGDASILALARRRGAWVLTADRDLRRRLLGAGVTVLVPRDVHRLERMAGERKRRTSDAG